MILLLMLVSLLPWGAFAAARSAQSAGLVTRHAMILASLHDSPASETRASRPAHAPTFALAPKKCRTATLPGFSCAPDPALHRVAATGLPPRHRATVRPAGDWTGSATAEAPPTGPPRVI